MGVVLVPFLHLQRGKATILWLHHFVLQQVLHSTYIDTVDGVGKKKVVFHLLLLGCLTSPSVLQSPIMAVATK
jgi:hypothetical protein